MFLRIVKAAGGKGVQHEYVRLVESYREHGKVKQRLVASLGRKDLLADHLEALNRLLSGQSAGKLDGRAEPRAEAVQAWDWGTLLAARSLWRELGLEQILDRLAGGRPRQAAAFSDRVFALVANRLEAPSSEHGLAGWLDSSLVCDRQGRRFVAQWRDDRERLASKAPRVRVAFGQLQRWYRTLDRLLALKAPIERELFLRLRSLFALKVDLVLYDLTSSYFEGLGPPQLGAHGYSRDGKPRNRQVLVGLVMIDGWPIAHHLFAGNQRDHATVPEVLADLEQRFGLSRLVFIGDRGMISAANQALLRAHGQGSILGLSRRRSKLAAEAIATAKGPPDHVGGRLWIECPSGITAREKHRPPRTWVQEVDAPEPGQRLFVVHSEERQGFEQTQRKKAMERVAKQLAELTERVAQGRLKAPEKIGAAAARILAKNHGRRYYDWALEDGRFRFFEHPVNFQREIHGEGKYVLLTEDLDLPAVEVVRLYKELGEVERAFRNLKDVIDMRPIFHQTDPRVQAHIFVAALAFLLHRALEKRLKAKGLDLSADQALTALKTLRVVDLDLGDGTSKRCVTQGSPHAAGVLKALDITERMPPIPPKREQTLA